MSKLKNLEPARYFYSEAVAQAHLELAKNIGVEALLTAAKNDVTIALKQWRVNSTGGSDEISQTTFLSQLIHPNL